jgi:RND superfamily putative drug exporter
MKLLGDDCWWAPRWMKRIQDRIGLGEVDLPDEKKRPTVRDPAEALVGAGAPVPSRPRPPHDPTHPAVEGASRPGASARAEAPPRANAPSGAGTTRMPGPRGDQGGEPPTTRLSMAKNAVRNVVHNATAPNQRSYRPAPQPPFPPPSPPAPPREDREIESWLGELRGTPPGAQGASPAPPPSADATRAIPEKRPRPPASGGQGSDPRVRRGGQGVPPAGGGQDGDQTTAIPVQRARPGGRGKNTGAGERSGGGNSTGAEPTTAIPVQRPQDPDATEKIDTRKGDDEERQRRGGVSAQDLLRREGRI